MVFRGRIAVGIRLTNSLASVKHEASEYSTVGQNDPLVYRADDKHPDISHWSADLRIAESIGSVIC